MTYLNSYHVKDTHGNIASAVAWDGYEEIHIFVKDNVVDSDGEPYNLSYTGEAKHLSGWCKHHKLQLRHQIVEVEIENPFDLED